MPCKYFTIFAIVLLLSACSSLPENVERPVSHVFASPEQTSLGQALMPGRLAHQGNSAFVVLNTGRQALASRINLVEAAERGIDAQYYIWNNDRSGRELAARMLAAADRGVKVRVLLDDFGIESKDELLFALDTHSHIQIRLYNPFPPGQRTGLRRIFGFFADFDRLAPRMHNKIFLVDGAVAISGGRNIGDEYFDLSEDRNFRDRDLMFHGEVMPAAAESFDASWNSEGAYPIAAISSEILDAAASSAILDGLRESRSQEQSPIPGPIPGPDSAGSAVEAITTAFEREAVWAPARLYYNPPSQAGASLDFEDPGVIAKQLLALARDVKHSLLIETGYLISGEPGLELYRSLDARQVQVEILTNSLLTNDVLQLHAGYTRTRRALIERGVELHELRPDAASCEQLIGSAERCAPKGRIALHAKSIVFDDNIVYVGSFNMNPRSAYLNTETAIVIYSRVLANRIAADIKENTRPENSWALSIDEDGQILWSDTLDGTPRTTTSEPATGSLQRFKVFLYSLIPMEDYL